MDLHLGEMHGLRHRDRLVPVPDRLVVSPLDEFPPGDDGETDGQLFGVALGAQRLDGEQRLPAATIQVVEPGEEVGQPRPGPSHGDRVGGQADPSCRQVDCGLEGVDHAVLHGPFEQHPVQSL
jgi:hypothetical protein